MFVMFTTADVNKDVNKTKIVVNAYSVKCCRKEKSSTSSEIRTVLYIEGEEQSYTIKEEPEEVYEALMECIKVPTVTCPPPPM